MFDNFFEDAIEFLPILLSSAVITILVMVASLIISTVLGFIWALARVGNNKALDNASRIITNIIRGIPIIVILFYMYFVMPDFGLKLSAFQAGALGLGLAYSSYMSEVFRGAIEAVDKGQIEAAQSIGMSNPMLMFRVVLPQAIKIALPPYGNNVVMLLKDTSQTSVITVVELSLQSKLIAAATFKNATVFTLVALVYLCVSLPLMCIIGKLENRYGLK